jgi:dihydropyrimidinase
MSILIKNGRIITATDDYVADIFIEGEEITLIGKNLNVKVDKVIDASGKYIFPGGIDPHVHLQMPFMGAFSSDDYQSGTLAALHGGTTTVIDFVIQKQGKSMKSALADWRNRSVGNTYCDYGFHIAVTDFNDQTKLEIKDLVQKEGITSFKAFMAYKGALMIDDRQMTGLMEEVKKYGGIVSVHGTNGDIIDYLVQKNIEAGNTSPLYHYLSQPEITESEATGRFIDMAYQTGVNAYIVHLTCEGSLNKVRDAARRNQIVMVETCVQYLLLDASVYDKGMESAKWVMSPPIREKKDQDALWSGINQGIVHTVATDHCPFMWDDKLKGKDDFRKIPNGAPGIEHRVELLYSHGVQKGIIDLNTMVDISSTASAKIFGMFPKKGTIAVGSDADLIIFDPNEKHTISAQTHHHHCDYSSYEGWELTGKCKTIILRGTVAIENGEVFIEKGYGEYIKRETLTKII